MGSRERNEDWSDESSSDEVEWKKSSNGGWGDRLAALDKPEWSSTPPSQFYIPYFTTSSNPFIIDSASISPRKYITYIKFMSIYLGKSQKALGQSTWARSRGRALRTLPRAAKVPRASSSSASAMTLVPDLLFS